MVNEIGFNYDSDRETIKTQITDTQGNSLIIYLSLYTVRGKYYIDIFTDDEELEMGRIVNCGVDLFQNIKSRKIDFPNCEMLVIPNVNASVDMEFSLITGANGLHSIYVIDDLEE